MRFGPVPITQATGLIAAHSVRAGDAVVKKGRPIGAEDAARLEAAGIAEVVAVALEPGDVGEDEAAKTLAAAVAGPGVTVEPPFTGRSNLHASQAGLLVLDEAAITAINRIDESVTLATLVPFKPVVPGEMVATVKIIPYAVPGAVLERALDAAAPAIRIAPYCLTRVAAISTLLPGLKPSVVDKTLRTLEARLSPAGARIVAETRVPHEAGAVARALREAIERDGADLAVVFGASAIADRRDVIPAGIEAAGGVVDHLGMPVDPGNLLLLGRLGDAPVIGAPGCARSPKENGFDWVLQRLLAGLPVTRDDIVGFGVGGLLMEIVSRPQPRDGGESADEA
ncbi:molybdopterin-binding protein [Methylobacterium currus]|jgi:molybdenum cofactor cytidylyltransferase|uniref:Molybdopterin-binding protein n=1 Tax=Methylobacterium currus TaxID=2051553 RepID=A0A2R4WHX5_9HYPH|nr:molybdopterin-binding protein [Methylobacterium currus]AWB21148.1 molybdopterin-binding protein [Methylobacterium currus]UHC14013.1 molybdopterin-binding protein [Methylobacterium currus]